MTELRKPNRSRVIVLFLMLFIGMITKLDAQAVYRQAVPAHINTLDAEKEPQRVLGSPYINEKFVLGIVYNTNRSPNEAYVRYNAYRDYVEFQLENNIFALDPAPNILKVDFGDHTMVVEEYFNRKEWVNGYFVLLDSGAVSLFKKYRVHYDDKEGLDEFGIEDFVPKFNRQPDRFYFKIDANGKLTKLTSVKKMIASFPEHHDEMKKFLKENKTSSRKEGQLIELISYYNSL